MYNIDKNYSLYKATQHTNKVLSDREIQLEQLKNLKIIKNILVAFATLFGVVAFIAIVSVLFSM